LNCFSTNRQASVSTERGFTLIEILIVVLVIGVLLGVVTTSFTGSSNAVVIEGFAQRMITRVEMARDKAIQQNMEWGMRIENDSYYFMKFNQARGAWSKYSERPFETESITSDIEMSVRADSYEGSLASQDQLLPHIVFFSSGEVTPFEISINHLAAPDTVLSLESDGFMRTALVEGEGF
tara:strand:+ start:1026 stop:1565 length:540 start_codon:yes stop_codon:yes gene_type:complete